MTKQYVVKRTDGETGAKTQAGGPVKTVEKAYNLMARMRAQQPMGSSTSFSIDTTR